MSWITVIWSMAAGVFLTLAAVNVLIWLRDRDAVANALFSVGPVAAAQVRTIPFMSDTVASVLAMTGDGDPDSTPPRVPALLQ